MPEEQMPYVIQYIRTLRGKELGTEQGFDSVTPSTPKMKAFLELEQMLVPVSPELDYETAIL